MDNIIVYGVNVNGYDDLKNPIHPDPNVRYIMLTDNKDLKSDVWEIQIVDDLSYIQDLRKKSRYWKVNSHLALPNHDISIYVDGNMEILISDFNKMLQDIGFEDKDIMLYKHRFRNCLYEEANEVIRLKLDYTETVSTQIKRYYNIGFPNNFGLFENGFIIRRNNSKIKRLNETWWEEIKNNSGRDQLSFMFSCWYNDVYPSPITIGKDMFDNDFIKYHDHLKHFEVVKKNNIKK